MTQERAVLGRAHADTSHLARLRARHVSGVPTNWDREAPRQPGAGPDTLRLNW